MHIIFSHGKESGPWGSKIRYLAEIAGRYGKVSSIDYQDLAEPDLRVKRLHNHIEHPHHTLLVGSSMGGYVSAVVAQQTPVAGLFLLAPAFFLPGYQVQQFRPVSTPQWVVHGWRDDVIPFSHSVRYAELQQCHCHLLDGEHRLNSALGDIGQLFEQCLRQLSL